MTKSSVLELVSKNGLEVDFKIDGTWGVDEQVSLTCPSVPKSKILSWVFGDKIDVCTHKESDGILSIEHNPNNSSIKVKIFDYGGKSVSNILSPDDFIEKLKEAVSNPVSIAD